MEIGEILIQLRAKCRLTQRDVAEYIGVRQNTYQSWESGQTGLKVEFLPKLAEIFKVPITELLPTCQPNHTGNNRSGGGPLGSSQPVLGTYPDYRDELIASQRREIELMQVRIVELTNRLIGGGGKSRRNRVTRFAYL